MNHYLSWRECKLTDINDIYMGPEMYNVINDLGKFLNGHSWSYEHGLVMDSGLLPLSRVDNMLNCFIKHMVLPPISLKKKNNRYEIVDGRHRIVMSIIFGYKQIPYTMI